jgi:hypothetical protein
MGCVRRGHRYEGVKRKIGNEEVKGEMEKEE